MISLLDDMNFHWLNKKKINDAKFNNRNGVRRFLLFTFRFNFVFLIFLILLFN